MLDRLAKLRARRRAAQVQAVRVLRAGDGCSGRNVAKIPTRRLRICARCSLPFDVVRGFPRGRGKATRWGSWRCWQEGLRDTAA